MERLSTIRFVRDRTGWILVILNLLMATNSTLYFTTQLKAGLDGWLAMNSCAPSIFIFVLGYIIRNCSVMAVGTGLMFRFGTLGLFVFGWEGMNLIPQAGHILMTLAVIYFMVKMINLRSGREFIVTAFVVVLMLYAEWQWKWFGRHPGILDALMKGTLKPQMFQ